MKKMILIVLGAILIIFGLLVPLTTTVVTFLLPETFAATALIAPANHLMSVTTEVQKIQSHAVLDRVITDLKLGEEWGRKYKQPNALSLDRCFVILQAMTKVSEQPNTALIQIRAFSENKDEAAIIANKIADVYRSSSPGATVIESAEPNSKPVRPNKPLNIVLGLLVGAIFAGFGIFLITVARKSKPS